MTSPLGETRLWIEYLVQVDTGNRLPSTSNSVSFLIGFNLRHDARVCTWGASAGPSFGGASSAEKSRSLGSSPQFFSAFNIRGSQSSPLRSALDARLRTIYPARMRTVTVPLGERSYSISIGSKLLAQLGSECQKLALGRRCA
jgi:hypothetical protein